MKHLKPLLQFIALLALIIVYSRWIVSLPRIYYDTVWPTHFETEGLFNQLYYLLVFPVSTCGFVLLGWLVFGGSLRPRLRGGRLVSGIGCLALYYLVILPIAFYDLMTVSWLVWLLLNVTGGHNSFACILLLLAGWALVIAGVFTRRNDKGENHEPETANPA